MLLVDFYGDDALELFSASGSTLSLWSGDGSGALLGPHLIAMPDPILAQAAADIDGDGHLDLLVASGGVSLLRNLDGGMLGSPQPIAATGAAASLISLDVNGDDCPDALTVDGRAGQPAAADGALTLLLNDCGGTLSAQRLLDLPAAVALAAADLNGDGWPDLVLAVAGPEPAVLTLAGGGDGSFSQLMRYPLPSAPGRLALADLDANGRPDVVVTLHTSGAIAVLLNDSP